VAGAVIAMLYALASLWSRLRPGGSVRTEEQPQTPDTSPVLDLRDDVVTVG
jgi:hypothetical protein